MATWRELVVAALALFWSGPVCAQSLEADADAQLRAICRADAGALWGADLCGPLLIVDPATRAAWATQMDAEGVLTLSPTGGGWTGRLPDGVPIANSAVDWGGVRWIMLTNPLPENAEERRVLVAHEAWHRIQGHLGLRSVNAENAHLETERGRYLLRLELRALATAMLSNGRARQRAARDALAFRTARHSEFPGSAAQEAALDRNEGLAAYTGVKLGATDPAVFAARTLGAYDQQSSFARSYAYASGPAYGLLLDHFLPGWRSALGAYAPSDLLWAPIRATPPSARALRSAAERYGGPQILLEERARAEAHRTRIAALRSQFTQGPRLELPLTAMQMEFDPNLITPIQDLGTVYEVITLRDTWGELRARAGALLSADYTRVVVAAPGPSGLSGAGWSLVLAPGYRISRADASGVIRPELATVLSRTP
jgi:hypothetical protein